MNIVDPGSLYMTLTLWVVAGVVIAVALNYFFRPRTRGLYPGGPRRYLIALIVQTAGFILPIPVVLLFLVGSPVPPELHVIVAVLVGIGVVYGLRMLPGTSVLLKDLHRARIEAVMQRLGPRT